MSEPPSENWAALLGSADPEARHRAMERYTYACSDTRWTGEMEPEFETLENSVHECALKELLTPDPAAPLRNRGMAMYCWWLTYRAEDAAHLVRLLTAPGSDYLIEHELADHTRRVISTALIGDRGLDGGLLDALQHYATTPGPTPVARARLLQTFGVSTHEKVVPWLLTALDDPDDIVSGGAAQSLLIYDKERFRHIVLADRRIDVWRDGDWTVPIDDFPSRRRRRPRRIA